MFHHDTHAHKGVLPDSHIVDTGYLDAELLVTSQRDYGVDFVGPTRADYQWQAQAAQGFAARSCHINWDQRQVICPRGHRSISWIPAVANRSGCIACIRCPTLSGSMTGPLCEGKVVWQLACLENLHRYCMEFARSCTGLSGA